LKNSARETIYRGPRLSDSERGFFSSAATLTLVLTITLSACVAVSAAEFLLGPLVLFEGALDGSASAHVGGGFFVGATDEDDILRLYDVNGGYSQTLDVGGRGSCQVRAWD